MCGICGEIARGGAAPSEDAVRRMMDVMRPRGPDADGTHGTAGVMLGHRRLKIIDLSDASSQPMVDEELGLSIVYNGAIYNYRDLREELEGRGYRFFSHGDTEVLLKAYHCWGREFVQRLNGMFAFAIVERDSGRVVLGRDRVGIKPLYYSGSKNWIRFASSLPALLAAGGVDTSVDPVALNYYCSFHSVVPPPHTILRGVRKLPPATLWIIEPDGSEKQERYWSLGFGPAPGDSEKSFEDWQDEALEVLRTAVRRRLIADVPVGVLLSGGLDSSLVVGLLAEHDRADIATFSIGFESVGGEEGDEFKYSDVIAEHFRTRHHKLFIDAARTLPALRDCVRHMSEPMTSHDNVGFYLLSQEVARHVKVVQSGQGADEIFGGYHWYPPLMESADGLADYRRHFFDRDFAEYAELVSPEFAGADHAGDFVREHFAQPGAASAIDRALRLDALVMLVDDPVKRVDNNTMAAGLEARVPFLDHEVVEFAARVPAELKIRDGGKYILKEAARRVIPSAVIDRPKGYFPVPALKYLRGDFLELAREYTTNETARRRGLFQPAVIERFLAAPEEHITPLQGSKLWQAALLEFWLQEHGI
jgi:asparagine synthase (glutamine-hydrolysing)